MCGHLKRRLQQERNSRDTWTVHQWARVVQEVAKEDWGAVSHGGTRPGKNKFGPSAVDEQQAVSAVGDAKSAVGSDESSATGKEQREEGQVAHTASAVGEEHASEQDKDSVIAPSVLPAEGTTLKTQRLVGYIVLQFIANDTYGDVYKASKNSIGELSAISDDKVQEDS